MKKWIIWGFGATVFGALLLLLLLPGDVVSTRLVGQWGVRVNVARGTAYTLPLVVQPARHLIQLCSDTWFRRETCQPLIGTVVGTETIVVIPPTYPLGRALVKVIDEVASAGQTPSQVQGRAFVNLSGSQQSGVTGPTVVLRVPIYVVEGTARLDAPSQGERDPETGGGAPPGSDSRPDPFVPSLPTAAPSTPAPSETPGSTPGF